ncbi:suppressor of fused domain protein [Paenibacillus arenosi]|uniref:Suppressor of fused domain protein n=1 Tax=Paenibacillus arenosi TaxID=2774142 RepID=A0ABR9AUN4_9BACL|nr:suppressor of fused domain protein [Paenibacillus arenosi]MBD8497389.1 suppressor of fused domain protein [Paenibacillus arenosi]
MSTYIDFLEKELGTIEKGWSTDAKGEKLPFDVVKYCRGPFQGTVTYSTLGISHHKLECSSSNKLIRHELFMITDEDFGENEVVQVLQQLGLEALQAHSPYLRGQVIGPRGIVFKGSSLEALYVSSPAYYPEEFHVYESGEELPIVQVWMIPITANEADYVLRYGWSQFEDILVEEDPDLIDFSRVSIV